MALTLAVTLGLVASACSGSSDAAKTGGTANPTTTVAAVTGADLEPYTGGDFYAPPSPLPKGPHGTLIRYQAMPKLTVGTGSTAYRILYLSETVQGKPTAVSGIAIVPKGAAGLTTRDFPTVDGFQASEVILENVKVDASALVGPADHALLLIEKVVDEALVATCAEACGVLAKLHEGTLEYTKQRKQFGQPIAAFQVLQHRMVDMFINVEQAVSMTYMAHIKLGGPDSAKSVSAAKVQIGRACKFVGQNAIQLHGGMGMTDEMAIGHYFKRATMIEGQFGSVDHHLRRYEGLSFDRAA